MKMPPLEETMMPRVVGLFGRLYAPKNTKGEQIAPYRCVTVQHVLMNEGGFVLAHGEAVNDPRFEPPTEAA